jgi:hypothetical protein
MLVVLTGYNRNSKFDLVANASNGEIPSRFCGRPRCDFDRQFRHEKDNYTFSSGVGTAAPPRVALFRQI